MAKLKAKLIRPYRHGDRNLLPGDHLDACTETQIKRLVKNDEAVYLRKEKKEEETDD